MVAVGFNEPALQFSSMLAGKPGDRKSSTINLAESIARKCLPPAAFLPRAFSPETLFDELDTENGGQPDKLLICDDANAILADWQKSNNGERNAARFLELYDCGGLASWGAKEKGLAEF